jgi:hypothetical protein
VPAQRDGARPGGGGTPSQLARSHPADWPSTCMAASSYAGGHETRPPCERPAPECATCACSGYVPGLRAWWTAGSLEVGGCQPHPHLQARTGGSVRQPDTCGHLDAAVALTQLCARSWSWAHRGVRLQLTGGFQRFAHAETARSRPRFEVLPAQGGCSRPLEGCPTHSCCCKPLPARRRKCAPGSPSPLPRQLLIWRQLGERAGGWPALFVST